MTLEGQQLGEFEILERLGQGGMGAVYKARQTSLDRFVALKTLQAGLADDAEYIARFKQEAKAAAVLSHPNLVQVYSAGENDGLHWFAMEYVEGESAKVRLKRKGRLDPQEAIAIAIHVATALEYGWRKANLIHRDIKPDNIFLSSDGEVKLGDLGLAKSAGQTQGLTITGTSMGTPHYISPEQVISTKSVDLRADIYSLGCTLFHMLAGRTPFDGDGAVAIMMQHVNSPVPDIRALWSACPAHLADVLLKTMQKDPALRQQNYHELTEDLRTCHNELTSRTPETLPFTPRVSVKKKYADEVSICRRTSKMRTFVALGVLIPLAMTSALILVKSKRDVGPIITSDASPDYPQPSQWLDATEELRAHYKNDGLEEENGWLRGTGSRIFSFGKGQTFADPIVRVLYKGRVAVDLRRNPNQNDERYDAAIGKGVKIALASQVSPSAILVGATLGQDYVAAAEHEAVFYVQRDTLVLFVDGKKVATAQDAHLNSGGLAVDLNNGGYNDGRVKKVEYGELSKEQLRTVPPDLATTKDPFVNSLGMRFVPVLGTKVLHSVWDTRVHDYAAYAATSKTDSAWKNQQKDGIPVSRGQDYPVVGVSWDDAQGFNQWLTNKEIAEGKLPKGAKYRLPTDEEWSIAVGLTSELGWTPAAKSQNNTVDYPWGKDYPPTKIVGNYADEAFHTEFPVNEAANDSWNKNHWIEGYSDAHATTSPAGSFRANRYGLCDMGGNVWQWCEDWFDISQKERVLRGGSWNDNDREHLLSSARTHSVPTRRNYTNGFRCVLELPAK